MEEIEKDIEEWNKKLEETLQELADSFKKNIDTICGDKISEKAKANMVRCLLQEAVSYSINEYNKHRDYNNKEY